MAKALVLVTLFSVLQIVGQIAIVHATRTKSIFRVMQWLFLATLVLIVPAFLATPDDLGFLPARFARSSRALGLVAALAFHVLFFFNWAQVFFYVTRSITLRMLVEFVKADGGVVSLDHLRGTYSLEGMVRGRYEALERNGWLRRVDGRLILSSKARAVAGTIRFFRKLMGLPFYIELGG